MFQTLRRAKHLHGRIHAITHHLRLPAAATPVAGEASGTGSGDREEAFRLGGIPSSLPDQFEVAGARHGHQVLVESGGLGAPKRA